MTACLTTSDAEAAALRDVDSLAEWLSGECLGWKRGDDLLLIDEATAEDFGLFPVAILMVLAFDQAQRANVRAAALNAIGNRYLKQPDTVAHCKRIQIELDEQRAADERQDREEIAAQFRRIKGYSDAADRRAA